MSDASTAEFLAEYWRIPVQDLSNAWTTANERRSTKLSQPGKDAAEMMVNFDAQLYWAEVQKFLRRRLLAFHEPRIVVRGDTVWVGPRPVYRPELAVGNYRVIHFVLYPVHRQSRDVWR
jgi:hypothetical protein